MKVTVCEMNNSPRQFRSDWQNLVEHVRTNQPNLVLLPEVPFAPWFAVSRPFEPEKWAGVLQAHEAFLPELDTLAPAVTLASRPVELAGRRLNQGFAWLPGQGIQPAHEKYYLPDDVGFWEASWYGRGNGEFVPLQHGEARIGFQICTEMWFFERSRAYGKAGANLIVVPRCTERQTIEKWLMGGRAAAVVSGAYCLSSNRVSRGNDPQGFGGCGWVVGPDGEILGVTSADQPFLTVEIDLERAEAAKRTYPRYVEE